MNSKCPKVRGEMTHPKVTKQLGSNSSERMQKSQFVALERGTPSIPENLWKQLGNERDSPCLFPWRWRAMFAAAREGKVSSLEREPGIVLPSACSDPREPKTCSAQNDLLSTECVGHGDRDRGYFRAGCRKSKAKADSSLQACTFKLQGVRCVEYAGAWKRKGFAKFRNALGCSCSNC